MNKCSEMFCYNPDDRILGTTSAPPDRTQHPSIAGILPGLIGRVSGICCSHSLAYQLITCVA